MINFLYNRTVNGKGFAPVVFMMVCLTFFASHGNAEEQKINYRLKWLINASVAGDIYADSQGIFKDYGLLVKVKPGGPERDAIRELELGKAQFGVASADQVIRALEKGASIVVIAQLFQKNPLQWIYRSDELTISSLDDVKGQKVGITYGGNDETIMNALLVQAGIKESELELTSVRYDYTPFLRKKVSIWPVYRNTQGIFLSEKLSKAGEQTGFLDPTSFGVKFVANSVVTSEKMLREKPEVVRAFHTALLKGWEEALKTENIEKSIQAIALQDKDSTKESLEKQLLSTRSLVKPERGFSIGEIDVKAWKQTEKIMLDQALIKEPVNIEKYLRIEK